MSFTLCIFAVSFATSQYIYLSHLFLFNNLCICVQHHYMTYKLKIAVLWNFVLGQHILQDSNLHSCPYENFKSHSPHIGEWDDEFSEKEEEEES